MFSLFLYIIFSFTRKRPRPRSNQRVTSTPNPICAGSISVFTHQQLSGWGIRWHWLSCAGGRTTGCHGTSDNVGGWPSSHSRGAKIDFEEPGGDFWEASYTGEQLKHVCTLVPQTSANSDPSTSKTCTSNVWQLTRCQFWFSWRSHCTQEWSTRIHSSTTSTCSFM